MTLVVNFFVTGVLAIIVGLMVILWSAAFVQRKNGGVVLILFSVALLLVGGGLAPIPLGNRSWCCRDQDKRAVNMVARTSLC